MGSTRVPLMQRFWPRVDVRGPDDCWVWLAGKSNTGYGSFIDDDLRTRGAHRIAYEALVGPVPHGLELDHLCRVRACVNPAHLEPVTHRENQLRGDTVGARNARATHCIRGHPFDEQNTYFYKNGNRKCRACAAKRMRDAKRRKRDLWRRESARR